MDWVWKVKEREGLGMLSMYQMYGSDIFKTDKRRHEIDH